MKSLKTGDKVRYTSDVHSDYTGQICTAIDFDLEHRLMGLRCGDGQFIVAFWNEVEEVPAGSEPA